MILSNIEVNYCWLIFISLQTNFFLVCPICLLVFFFLFNLWLNQDWVFLNQPGMALTPFPSSVVWDKIWTHDPSIMNLVCYPLDQAWPLCRQSFFYKIDSWFFCLPEDFQSTSQFYVEWKQKKKFSNKILIFETSLCLFKFKFISLIQSTSVMTISV